jgi:hypothetical protein
MATASISRSTPLDAISRPAQTNSAVPSGGRVTPIGVRAGKSLGKPASHQPVTIREQGTFSVSTR